MAKQKEDSNMLPVLAAAALGGAAGGDDRLKELLVQLVEDQLEKRKKEKEKMKRFAESSVQAAKEEKAMREARVARCSHRKQNGETRLAGQRLSNGQLALVCQYCGQDFFDPPLEGQKPVPRELMPPADEIGG